MKNYPKIILILFSILMISCLKDNVEPKDVIVDEPDPDEDVFSFPGIIEEYSGEWTSVRETYWDYMDDSDPPAHYYYYDNGLETVQVEGTGLDSLLFSPEELNFICFLNGSNEHFLMDSITQTLSYINYGAHYCQSMDVHFAGPDLDSLYITTYKFDGSASDSHEDYWADTYSYKLKKD